MCQNVQITEKRVLLRNEFNFRNVRGIMNTSGLLQSNIDEQTKKLNLLLIFTFYYELKYKNYL